MRKLFAFSIPVLAFMLGGILYSCKDADHIGLNVAEHKEAFPEDTFWTELYPGVHIESEPAESIGAAIGLSAEKTKLLAGAIREHEREIEKIKSSDYAPFLAGILWQNENERYRNSIIAAIGYDDYCKWFDYDRAAMDRNMKSRYDLDEGQLAQFKKIVKDSDVEIRSILRTWSSREEKEVEVIPLRQKRDEAIKNLTGLDITCDEMLVRSGEVRY